MGAATVSLRTVLPTLPGAGPQRWLPGRDPRAERIPAPVAGPATLPAAGQTPHVAVVGGGIAGMGAAVCLAERGVRVTLLERDDRLGGRVSAWPVSASDQPDQGLVTSRGFHAFFRQYYNLRALLRRVDPDLAGLRPVEDYPLLHADGTRDSFTHVPRRPPWSILGFVAQSPSFPLSALPKVDVERALGLLDVAFPATYSAYDGVSAARVLDELRFPEGMRHLALEVFARSFFADPREFSGGELVAMFHTYFLGSSEGLLFDVAADDFDSTFWAPLGRYHAGLGVDVRCGTAVSDLAAGGSASGIRLNLAHAGSVDADAVVLALPRDALQAVVAASPTLGDEPWRAAVAAGRMAPRFLVQRLWFDRPVADDTPLFLGTAELGRLDNVSAIHLMEAGAAEWARRTGGSVVELHAYAVPDDVSDDEVTADLRAQLDRLHPELAGARVLHEEVLVRADCPLAGTDPWAARPGVTTPDPGVVLAGDGIRCELPVALMERAATTGMQAANALLGRFGLGGHGLWTVPTRGRFGPAVSAARRAAALILTPGGTP